MLLALDDRRLTGFRQVWAGAVPGVNFARVWLRGQLKVDQMTAYGAVVVFLNHSCVKQTATPGGNTVPGGGAVAKQSRVKVMAYCCPTITDRVLCSSSVACSCFKASSRNPCARPAPSLTTALSYSKRLQQGRTSKPTRRTLIDLHCD